MTDNPVEQYLDTLFVELDRASPRDARSLLREAESHLWDAAQEGQRRGLTQEEAELDAVRRFGGAREIAVADRGRRRFDLLRSMVVSAWSLGSTGALAIGASGVVAGIMRLGGASNRFIVGQSTVNLRASDCARWLSGYPAAHSCAQAALDDWASETVGYRLVVGVMGLLAIGALMMARRRWSHQIGWDPLPRAVVDSVATSLFGISGLWLAGLGIDAWVVKSGAGAGQWLSAAPVALGMGLVFGLRLARDVSGAPRTTAH